MNVKLGLRLSSTYLYTILIIHIARANLIFSHQALVVYQVPRRRQTNSPNRFTILSLSRESFPSGRPKRIFLIARANDSGILAFKISEGGLEF